jgi:hypothetical protein
MILTKYKSLGEAKRRLNTLGYENTFNLTKGQLVNRLSGDRYTPESVALVEFHRFPNAASDREITTVYVLETIDGQKGLLTATYRFYPGLELTRFLNQVRVKPA